MPLDDLTNSTNGSVAELNGDSANSSNSAQSTTQESNADLDDIGYTVDAKAYLDDKGGLYLEFYLPLELQKELYSLSPEADEAAVEPTATIQPLFPILGGSHPAGRLPRARVPIGRAPRGRRRPPFGRPPR